MPLVPPGIMSPMGEKGKWANQLMGKEPGDSNDATTFATTDLPSSHRIVRPGDMQTTDHVPDRLNVHLGEDGTVQDVNYG